MRHKKQSNANRGTVPGISAAGESPPDRPQAAIRPRAERALIWGLCIFAALRVLAYCAIFPFFNNVDEPYHFDLVVKYSHGEVPARLEPVSQESARYIILYGTPEYIHSPKEFPNGEIPPPTWTYPQSAIEQALPIALARWRSDINHEALEPPLYYALAGLWMKAGRACGLSGGYLLYWIRFLNPLLAGALVWIGYMAAGLVFPGRLVPRLGVPALLAIFPQDMFYSIQSDVLSPVFFGLAFIGVLQWQKADAPSVGLALFTGLALAAAGLTKGANWPLVAVALIFLLVRQVRLAQSGNQSAKRFGSWRAISVLCTAVLLPLGGWLARNALVVGDATGSVQKTKALGWTPKPLAHWLPHPILTPSGLWEFWSGLLPSFWRGEFVWFNQRIASPLMDDFYWLSSLVFLAVAVPALFASRRFGGGSARGLIPTGSRAGIGLAFASFAAAVAFLAVTSMAFDYGKCVYPSRAHPFFTSGRLITGALVPFLILYVYGIDRAFGFWKSDWPGLLVVAAVALLITVSEAELNSPALVSAYNWFGLWAGKSP